MQDSASVLKQHAARLCQGNAASVAQQEGLPQLHFELANVARQERLRNAEHRCGAGETTHFGDAHERFDLLEIHGLNTVTKCRISVVPTLWERCHRDSEAARSRGGTAPTERRQK